MIRTMLKLLGFVKAPRTTYVVLNTLRSMSVGKPPAEHGRSRLPRLSPVATALLVGPLAYRLGKRSAEGTLRTPRAAALDVQPLEPPVLP